MKSDTGFDPCTQTRSWVGQRCSEGPEKMNRWAVLTKAGMVMVIVKLPPITLHKAKCMGHREFATVFDTFTWFNSIV